MTKIVTIVGTRPEIIKLCLVIGELDKYCEHVLVHTGQNYDYELNEVFFQQLGIRKPDYFLNVVGDNLGLTIGNIISNSYNVLFKEKPDGLLIYGDTNSCLSAISAKRLKIPVFHMEAGNRCFDERVPEEINRKIIDHISDINMTITEHARKYLLSEGLKPERVFKIGSSIKEVFKQFSKEIRENNILEKLDLKENKYFVISMHREENVDNDKNFNDFLETIIEIEKEYKLPIIVSTHPRTKKRLSEVKKTMSSNVLFSKPFGYFEYIKLQMNAFCVISDSGTITEEASVLNFPAITIRESHERPEGMDEGTLIMTGLKSIRILESIKIISDQFYNQEKRPTLVEDYNVENVSLKVVRIIFSYIDFVKKDVWKIIN